MPPQCLARRTRLTTNHPTPTSRTAIDEPRFRLSSTLGDDESPALGLELPGTRFVHARLEGELPSSCSGWNLGALIFAAARRHEQSESGPELAAGAVEVLSEPYRLGTAQSIGGSWTSSGRRDMSPVITNCSNAVRNAPFASIASPRAP